MTTAERSLRPPKDADIYLQTDDLVNDLGRRTHWDDSFVSKASDERPLPSRSGLRSSLKSPPWTDVSKFTNNN